MLSHPMRERETQHSGTPVKVEGVSFDAFRTMLVYLYTGEASSPHVDPPHHHTTPDYSPTVRHALVPSHAPRPVHR